MAVKNYRPHALFCSFINASQQNVGFTKVSNSWCDIQVIQIQRTVAFSRDLEHWLMILTHELDSSSVNVKRRGKYLRWRSLCLVFIPLLSPNAQTPIADWLLYSASKAVGDIALLTSILICTSKRCARLQPDGIDLRFTTASAMLATRIDCEISVIDSRVHWTHNPRKLSELIAVHVVNHDSYCRPKCYDDLDCRPKASIVMRVLRPPTKSTWWSLSLCKIWCELELEFWR